MFSATRRLPLACSRSTRRLLHASAPAFVNVGDKLPAADLVEGSPGNKVNLAHELSSGRGIVIGTHVQSRCHCERQPTRESSRCPSSFQSFL